MRKVTIVLALVLLTACGTINVEEVSNNVKRIEMTALPLVFPPEAAVASPEVQSSLSIISVRECPNGYRKLKEQYLPDNGKGDDAVVWEIRCLG